MKRGFATGLAGAMVLMGTLPGTAIAGTSPEIRLTPDNQVPSCVTPQRLMTFLQTRNRNLDPRFKDIATHYKKLGEGWRVRWDYAFFQMAIETNFLSYRRPDGQWGDVDPKQNNFAGIGTTGGGVPGDRFPDVKTGVLGQIQHLVAYSGERMAAPTAPRTQLKQDDIVLQSQKLNRPVRFSDLARRWAVDPKYGSSIEWVADAYRSEHCRPGDAAKAAVTHELPWAKNSVASVATQPAVASQPVLAVKPRAVARTVWVSSPRGKPVDVAAPATQAAPVALAVAAAVSPPSGLGAQPLTDAQPLPCRVATASYGGKKTILIRAPVNGEQHYTALTVLDGFEKSMTGTFIATRAPGGETLGEFADKDEALLKAREFCPGT